MKLYYISEQSDPGKINLDDLLNRYRNYDFHFYTEYPKKVFLLMKKMFFTVNKQKMMYSNEKNR